MDLKSLTPSELASLMGSLGEPAYRAGQIMRWLYVRDEPDIAEWTDLPVALRERLAAEAMVTRLEEVDRRRSPRDGTSKFLWRLADGETIEGVAIPEGKRLTVCFSTQVGCAMGCAFCATGLDGFSRDLTPGEIVDQVLLVRAAMGERVPGARVTNAVAMGQGEPFRNYRATLTALRLMNDPQGLGIGARHLTVSTCGVVDGIKRLSTEPEQFGLAVSLHAATQKTRDSLVPAARRWPLSELKEACRDYSERTGRRVTFECAMLAGVNDAEADVAALVDFCRGMLCHVDLIPANPVEGSPYARATRARAEHFKGELAAAGVEATVRAEKGADIDAACGQLRRRPIPWG